MLVPKRLSIFGIAFAVCSALATPAAASEKRDGVTYRLDNGLRVVLQPMAGLPSVTMLVSYGTGASADPPRHNGLAHLTEHLTYRGSRHIGKGGLIPVLHSIGAEYRGYTALQSTGYVTTAVAEQLPAMLWLESERMGFALDGIDAAALEVERRVVVNEVRERGGDVWAHIADELYGRDTVYAEEGDSGRLTLGDVQWFFQSAYRPENATLVLFGRFDPDRARALVDQYFGPIRASGLAPIGEGPPPPKLCGSHTLDVHHPYRDASLDVVWIVPYDGSPEQRARIDALTLLAGNWIRGTILESGFAGADVYARATSFSTHALWSATIEFNAGTPAWKHAEALVWHALTTAASEPISSAQLRSMRAELLTDLALAWDDPSGAVSFLADHGPGGLDAYRKAVESLDGAAMQRSVAELLPQDRVLLARWIPKSDVSGLGVVGRRKDPCR